MIRAILGGTFDPPHAGHVAMARHVLEQALADHVLVIPNWQSPHREAPVAAPADRLEMCRIAFNGIDEVSVDDMEIRTGAACTMVDTLARVAEAYPQSRLRLVIGADHWAGFHAWRNPERILEFAEVVVLGRGDHPLPSFDPADAGADPARFIFAPDFDHRVSSTHIRAMLAAGNDPGTLLPSPVAAYIAAHRVYRRQQRRFD